MAGAVLVEAHAEFGRSTYDTHTDGSGVHYSSSLRPIVSLRPKFRTATGGPWQFPADLHLAAWLDALDIEVDVATDRELHDEGAELLGRYAVVMTGSHPEYYSGPMLDAGETYLASGGRAMYLGANGFYWVANWHSDKKHLMEVRKGELGSRAWQANPGEYYLQTNGQRSGLWRGRARAPQKIFGTGFAAEGFDESSYYVQMPDARDERAAFIMEGIDPGARIGDFGQVGGRSGRQRDRSLRPDARDASADPAARLHRGPLGQLPAGGRGDPVQHPDGRRHDGPSGARRHRLLHDEAGWWGLLVQLDRVVRLASRERVRQQRLHDDRERAAPVPVRCPSAGPHGGSRHLEPAPA